MDNYANYADILDNPFAVDFSAISFNEPPKKQYMPIYKRQYAHDTSEYYKALRVRKMDPITLIELDSEISFEYKFMWDPYTGDILEPDPHGSLWFDPNVLIKYFHTNRLNQLWVEPKDEQNGYFEGYYDVALGCGSEIYIQSRGHHPERYLFRLPIIDCYLTSDHKGSVITMGPILSDEDIALIDSLAAKTTDLYKKTYGVHRPSLTRIKYLYDQALSMTPNIEMYENDETLKDVDTQSLYEKANRNAVDQLKKIKG